MKKLLVLAAALLLTAFYVQAQETPVDYCYDEATGTFCIYVQEAIEVTGPESDICLGEICPGCSYTLSEDECMLFTVTGGDECWIYVEFDGQTAPAENYYAEEGNEVYLDGYWQYLDDSFSGWEMFDETSQHWGSNMWPLDEPNDDDDPNTVEFRLCGTINTSCYAEEGMYNIEIGLTAEYTCGLL